MKKVIMLFVAGLLQVAAFAQPDPGKTLPSKTLAQLNKLYPNAELIEVSEVNDGKVVEIIHEDYTKMVHFNAAGDWQETLMEVYSDEIPAKVSTAIDGLTGEEGYLNGIQHVTTCEAKEFYRAEVEFEKELVTFTLDPAGKMVEKVVEEINNEEGDW